MNAYRRTDWFILAFLIAIVFAIFVAAPAQAEDIPPLPESPATPQEASFQDSPPGPDVGVPDLAEHAGDFHQPLAEQLAILAEPDPWFYCSIDTDGTPDGQCHFTDLQNGSTGAVDRFTTQGGSGMIYVEAGVYNNNVSINAIPKLTGIIGAGGTVFAALPTTKIGLVNVINQSSNFTMQGLVIGENRNTYLELAYFGSNAGTLKLIDLTISDNTQGPGLYIDHAGAVSLDRVTIDHNTATAARNWNAYINASGKVTLRNVEVDHNGSLTSGGTTLQITSYGSSIALDGVSVSDNTVGDGVRLSAVTGITIRNGTFSLNSDSQPLNDYGYGIYILDGSAGAVLIENVFTEDNQAYGVVVKNRGAVTLRNVVVEDTTMGYGLLVDTCFDAGGTCGATGIFPVSVYNSVIENSGWDGISIWSSGNVLLDGVTSNDNGMEGAELYNGFDGKSGWVKVQGSQFLDNEASSVYDRAGLFIESNGAVTLKRVYVTGTQNGAAGSKIDNSGGTAGVSILGSLGNNFFTTNAGSGLEIATQGAVVIELSSITDNGSDGINLDATPSTIASLKMTDVDLAGNDRYGILAEKVRGSITLNRVQVTDNDNGGAYFNNCQTNGSACAYSGAVKITESYFSSNDGTPDASYYPGININSGGSVTLTSVDASYNGGHGLLVWNHASAAKPGITLKRVTIQGNKDGAGDNYGAILESKGAILVSNAYVSGNTGHGLVIKNTDGTAGVTVNTVRGQVVNGSSNSQFNDNTRIGLFIYTNGAISVKNAEANENDWNGLFLNNINSPTPAGMTVSDVHLRENGRTALEMTTRGNVSLKNVFADDSADGWGMQIGDSSNPFNRPRNVTLTNCSSLGNQDLGGVGVYATGAIAVNGFSGQGNTNIGLWLDNTAGTAGVSVKQVDVYSSGVGITIESHGAVALSDLSTRFNGVTGLRVGFYNGAVKSISGARLHAVYDGAGMELFSNGSVTLTSVTAVGATYSYGAYINTCIGVPCTASGMVKVTWGNFNGNFQDGLYIYSGGAVVLTDVYASFNGVHVPNINPMDGAHIENQDSISPAGVTITRGSFSGNDDDGIEIRTNGNVVFNGLSARDNQGVEGSGVNMTIGGTGTLTLLNSAGTNHFDNNKWFGMYVNANSLISLKGLTTSGNGRSGLWLDTEGNVTITSAIADHNLDHGIYIDTAGTITLTTIHTAMNGDNVPETLSYPDSGIVLRTGSSTIKLTNAISMSNWGHGIFAHFVNPGTLTLKNSLYYGNDAADVGYDNIDGDNMTLILQ